MVRNISFCCLHYTKTNNKQSYVHNTDSTVHDVTQRFYEKNCTVDVASEKDKLCTVTACNDMHTNIGICTTRAELAAGQERTVNCKITVSEECFCMEGRGMKYEKKVCNNNKNVD